MVYRSNIAMSASTVGLVTATDTCWRSHDSVSHSVNSSRLYYLSSRTFLAVWGCGLTIEHLDRSATAGLSCLARGMTLLDAA